MLIEKLAADVKKMAAEKGVPMSEWEMATNDWSEMAGAAPPPEALAAMAGLGGLASYGAISGKRTLEKSLIDKLTQDVRAAELATRISENARAREILDGQGWAKTQAKQLSRIASPNNIVRNAKANVSGALLKLLRGAQKHKIL